MKISSHYFQYRLINLLTQFIRYSYYLKTFLIPHCSHISLSLPLLRQFAYSFTHLLALTPRKITDSASWRLSLAHFKVHLVFNYAPRVSFVFRLCIFEDFYLSIFRPLISLIKNLPLTLMISLIRIFKAFLVVPKIAVFSLDLYFSIPYFDQIQFRYSHQLFRRMHLFLSFSQNEASSNSALVSSKSCIANQNLDFICQIMSYYLFLLEMLS